MNLNEIILVIHRHVKVAGRPSRPPAYGTAGACQSLYNEIIKAGANFASAPFRALIHALDPVLVCHTIAFAGIGHIVSPREVINATMTGVKGIGGIETRGKYRDGFPLEPYIV